MADLLALRGKLSQRKLAARFGISQAQVNNILRGNRWAGVARPPWGPPTARASDRASS